MKYRRFSVGQRKGAARVNRALKSRNQELQRLVPLWPHEISDLSLPGRLRLLNRLRSALRRERRLGLAGHWSYDVARHRQLLDSYRREVSAVREQISARRSQGLQRTGWPSAER